MLFFSFGTVSWLLDNSASPFILLWSNMQEEKVKEQAFTILTIRSDSPPRWEGKESAVTHGVVVKACAYLGSAGNR